MHVGQYEVGVECETRTTGEGANVFLPSLPRVACLALHARLALAFARLNSTQYIK